MDEKQMQQFVFSLTGAYQYNAILRFKIPQNTDFLADEYVEYRTRLLAGIVQAGIASKADVEKINEKVDAFIAEYSITAGRVAVNMKSSGGQLS